MTRLSILVVEVKFAVFAAYNNTARRVSKYHIERLNNLTKKELKSPKKIKLSDGEACWTDRTPKSGIEKWCNFGSLRYNTSEHVSI